jgi:hypothetical protein
MATIDSVGIKNVKRFKKMFGTERGIWLTNDQLGQLITELKKYKDCSTGEDCTGVGFMVGIGEDLRFNVEVIPLQGQVSSIRGQFSVKEPTERDIIIDKKATKEALGSITRVIKRNTWWDGDFLVRDNSSIHYLDYDDRDQNGMPKVKSYEGQQVVGLYDGSLQLTHEQKQMEGQRFPPPYID